MPIAVDDSGQVLHLNEKGEWAPAATAVNPQTKRTVAYDGKDWIEVVPPSRTIGQTAGDVGLSMANGASFGFAGEGLAAGQTALGLGKPTYGENLADWNAREKEIPLGIKVPGEIAGAVGTTAAMAPIAGAAGLVRVPALIRNPAMGALGGALFGAGEAEPGQRLEGAGKGGLIGLGAGAAVPPAFNALAGGAREIRGALQPSANVASDLARAIKRDQSTIGDLAAATQSLQATRPGVATVADAGGENVRGLLERVAQTPGAGRTTVVPFLTDRQQGQMARISGDLRSLTGTSKSASQAVSETMEKRSQDAKPLYDEAFNFNAREVPEIVRTWQQETSTGYGRAFMLNPNFRKTLQTEYGIKDPADAPLMVQIDAWKKVADDFISENIGTNKARVAQAMRARMLEVVDNFNPKYAEARNAWAGPSEYLRAIDEGRNIFSTKVSGEELAAGIGAMTDTQKEAYRIGAISSVIGKMGNDPAKLGDMTKYLRSPEMRAKIAALMPDDASRAAWQQRLNFEVGSSELTGRALGNSATARRQAEQADSQGIVGDLVMDAFSGSPPVSLLRKMIGAVPTKVRDTLRSRSDQVLAELLTDPNSMNGLVQAMNRIQGQGAGSQSILRNTAGINAANAGTQGAQ